MEVYAGSSQAGYKIAIQNVRFEKSNLNFHDVYYNGSTAKSNRNLSDDSFLLAEAFTNDPVLSNIKCATS